ncbi:hypothetical protein B0T14DRAFT_526719 [Immersiella caudata]|uniref:Uncharacterized protein n=1 Tax=Immersiella caudata TaxID=314043 RepID=A0AA40BU34_9PEZI|nr:hypothetical protein B0T14DRAFT_526719 [Immersiella caudata]
MSSPNTANQFGDGNRMFNNFGGSQKNIEGGNYKSGGGRGQYTLLVWPHPKSRPSEVRRFF